MESAASSWAGRGKLGRSWRRRDDEGAGLRRKIIIALTLVATGNHHPIPVPRRQRRIRPSNAAEEVPPGARLRPGLDGGRGVVDQRARAGDVDYNSFAEEADEGGYDGGGGAKVRNWDWKKGERAMRWNDFKKREHVERFMRMSLGTKQHAPILRNAARPGEKDSKNLARDGYDDSLPARRSRPPRSGRTYDGYAPRRPISMSIGVSPGQNKGENQPRAHAPRAAASGSRSGGRKSPGSSQLPPRGGTQERPAGQAQWQQHGTQVKMGHSSRATKREKSPKDRRQKNEDMQTGYATEEGVLPKHNLRVDTTVASIQQEHELNWLRVVV
ncbi:hypothetical protein B0H16DRAFT_1788708 [Mycena metata]|uniref:Btz domain-containing protein n=1 Tax=Mycena metata TaxID=1033252 RepID=A0AAD7HKD0_9AGAR|nr:hypothetical protein B0H16DRAFT_1788708 [Mycena metata]